MDVQSVLAHAKKFGKFGLEWIEQYRSSINVSSVRADSTSVGPGLAGGAATFAPKGPHETRALRSLSTTAAQSPSSGKGRDLFLQP